MQFLRGRIEYALEYPHYNLEYNKNSIITLSLSGNTKV